MSWASFFPRAQAEDWRAAMDDQKATHEGELGAERESHAKTTAAFNAEERARVKAEQDLAIGMAKWEKEKDRMQMEISSLRGYSSSANRALHDNTMALKAQNEREREQLEERHHRARETLLKQNRALQDEIDRLRRVQREVLDSTEALPGGPAREYLFYEAIKTRKVLSSPGTSISWRGVNEEPPPPLVPSTAGSPFAPSDYDAATRLAEARARGIPPGVIAAKAAKAAKTAKATKAVRSSRPESARQASSRSPPWQ